MSNYPVPEASKDTARNYGGIVEALKKLRASIGAPERNFPHNFQGIIEAILSLTKYGGSAEGQFPPNWDVITDDDGNIIGGGYDPPIQNGRLWFDERCGRLFVWVDDGWYQTNGADGLAKVQDTVPTEQVSGSFWFNTTNDTLYVYDGDNGAWTVVGGTGTLSTATLPLSNPTRLAFGDIQPTSIFPDHTGNVVQMDANLWFLEALLTLETELDNIQFPKPLIVDAVAPPNPDEGDLWYDTNKLELLAFYDKVWVPTSVPFIDQDLIFYDNSISALNTGLGLAEQNINTLQALVDAIPERRTYTIGTDKHSAVKFAEPDGIYVVDDRNDYIGIGVTGTYGINVTTDTQGVTISGEVLEAEIERVEAACASVEDLALTDAFNTQLSEEIVGVQQSINTLQSSHLLIAEAVDELPTFTDLAGRLSTSGGTISGTLDMSNNPIANVGAPTLDSDAIRKADLDNLAVTVSQDYVSKDDAIMKELKIRKEDTLNPSIDFSESVSYGKKAFQFKTNGGINRLVTFGTTSNPFEYAWKFDDNENFAWEHSANGYTFAIDKTGAYATNLYVGNFNTPTSSGLAVTNKINVGDTLSNTSSALTALKSAINTSTDFADFQSKALVALQNF